MRLCLVGALLLIWSAPALADPAHRRDAVVEVVQKVSPAVVYIGTEQIIESRGRDSFGPFEDFFAPRERRQAVQSLGSGVIIDPSGVIVTNDHVIRGASAIHVVLADGRQLDADVIGSDADNDLAVLKVDGKAPLPAAKLGTSSDLMIGETVIAIGSPFGLAKTVTRGVVSAVGRSFNADGRAYNDFVQTDAAINPGNSGGPLLNIDGEIIGINTAIFASAQGIGFAIPADKVKRIVSELQQFGKVRPSWIGIEVQALTPKLAAGLAWDRNYGVVVSKVDPGSPAEQAGVARGDIIAEISGGRVEDAGDFMERLKGYPARSKLELTLVREGKPQQLALTAVEFPDKMAESLAWERLGLRLRPAKTGMLITSVRNGSDADQVGLEPGDVMLRLNNKRLQTMDEFRDSIVSARHARSVLLLVQRGRAAYYITLPF